MFREKKLKTALNSCKKTLKRTSLGLTVRMLIRRAGAYLEAPQSKSKSGEIKK